MSFGGPPRNQPGHNSQDPFAEPAHSYGNDPFQDVYSQSQRQGSNVNTVPRSNNAAGFQPSLRDRGRQHSDTYNSFDPYFNDPALEEEYPTSHDSGKLLGDGVVGGRAGAAFLGNDSTYDASSSTRDLVHQDFEANSKFGFGKSDRKYGRPGRFQQLKESVLEAIPTSLGGNKGPVQLEGTRTIYINDVLQNDSQKFSDNHVSTSKYNTATFLPKFLYEQFSKYANLFFLFTAAIQQVPGVSPTNRYTTIGPLALVLLASAFKEVMEDIKRHRSDAELNARITHVLEGSQFEERIWRKVKVGDIVRLEGGDHFPADMAILSSSEPDGLCYIETSNLDGETNLKIKQAVPETANVLTPVEASRLGGHIKSEQPNNSLYTFEATMMMNTGGGEKEIPLSPDQLLLRGAQLRNTRWVYAIVIFTGHETKLMRNATAAPIKRTAVERMVNVQILFLFGLLIILSIASSIGALFRTFNNTGQLAYLDVGAEGSKWSLFGYDILTFVILYNNLIPISLIVTMEVVKFQQAALINSDLDMYYEKTDTAALCRTSSLVEELGQIEYIFSDKTGTLTCNMMEFRQCTIAGRAYADVVEEGKRARVVDGAEVGQHDFKALQEHGQTSEAAETVKEFITLLAVCHTVIPERSEEDPSVIKFQASSPDEGALVEGARLMGYAFTTRKPKSIIVNVQGRDTEFQILNVLEFNSTRKRMSTIVRGPDGKLKLYTKGADTVILERLAEGNPHVEQTLTLLEEYATEGLRTLCLAMREISEAEYKQWSSIYDRAATTISNRAEALDKAAELIEKNLYLLGATAIEDKLQDGVPETIHTLQQAGIKVWVLTGDRVETAVNIGFSAKLLTEEMSLIMVSEESHFATKEFLEKRLSAIKGQRDGGVEMETLALVIDGKSLGFALEKDIEKTFMELAVMCKAVLCCRVSPLQKALVVKLVKKHQKAILLAIGDGANDVGMIQAAHVGVGISGLEGLQAARSADVAISQFRYLKKLLLVHGAWSYQRLSKLILYSFYKNITLYMTQFWYAFQNGFSGQVIYESWTISMYNVFFTVLPPLVIGIFDQYVSARMLDRYPQLYTIGQKNAFFNVRTFWSWAINAFYHSLVLYLASIFIFRDDLELGDGQIAGHWVWGATLYTAVLLTVLGKAALISDLWTKYTLLAIPGSFAFWMVFLPIYGTVAPKLNFSTEYFGTIPKIFSSAVFWFTILLIPVFSLMRDFAWKYARRMYYPSSYHYVQEIQKYNIPDYRPRMEQFQKAIRKVRAVQRLRRNRGFAFSQNESGQERLIRAYDTTQSKPRG